VRQILECARAAERLYVIHEGAAAGDVEKLVGIFSRPCISPLSSGVVVHTVALERRGKREETKKFKE
jgi:hypothetical protein